MAHDDPVNAPDSLASLNGMTVYGLDLSYFTGKLQSYLRYCELPYRFVDMNIGDMRKVAQKPVWRKCQPLNWPMVAG